MRRLEISVQRSASGPHAGPGRREGVQGAAILLVARAISIGAQAVALGFQARALGVRGFGTLATVTAINYLAMTFCEFGLGTRSLRVAAEGISGIATQIARLRLLSITVVVVVTAISYSSLRDAGGSAVVVAAGFFVAGEICGELGVTIYLGERRRSLASFWMVSRRLISVIPFLFFGLNEIAAVYGLVVAGVWGVSGCVVIALRKGLLEISLLRLMRSGIPYWGASLVGSLQRLDVLIVGFVAGPAIAGLYGASSRLSNPLNTVTSILFQFAVPELSAESNPMSKRKRFNQLRNLVVCYAILLGACSAFSKSITEIVLGSKFSDGSIITAGVIVAAALSAIAQTQTAWFLSTEMPRSLTILTIAGSVLGLTILGLLTWALGAIGAALGTVAVNLVLLAAISWPFYRGRLSKGDGTGVGA